MSYVLTVATMPNIPGALGIGRGQAIIYHGNEHLLNTGNVALINSRIAAFTT